MSTPADPAAEVEPADGVSTPADPTAEVEDADEVSTRERRPTIEQLRMGLVQMLGAERRLLGRDHNRAGELTFGQVRALATLGREREMTAGQLARNADLNPATVTAILDHLEAAEIVQRRRSTEDRRVCNVSLTPRGWALLERKLAAWHTQWEQKFADFSDEDLAVAARVIGGVTDIYDALAAPRSGGDALAAPPEPGQPARGARVTPARSRNATPDLPLERH